MSFMYCLAAKYSAHTMIAGDHYPVSAPGARTPGHDDVVILMLSQCLSARN